MNRFTRFDENSLMQVKMVQQNGHFFTGYRYCSLPKKIPRIPKGDYFRDRHREQTEENSASAREHSVSPRCTFIFWCWYCKGNLSFWKALKDCDIGIKQVFVDLGKQAVLENYIVRQLEHYVCLLYKPVTTLVNVNELRWWIFRLKQAEAERLPPTNAALIQPIKIAHFQRIIWYNDTVAYPNIPSPSGYG